MKFTQAKTFFEHVRGLAAFNMPKEARKLGANQYGTRYVFPDGSRLRIHTDGNMIEWRQYEQGPGAIRVLFGGWMMAVRLREVYEKEI